ncbi:pseudouridylate synthase 7 homolog [Crassostrea virginica]
MTRRGKGRFGGRGHWRGRGRGRGGYGRTSSESVDPEVPGSQGAETEGTEEGGQEEQGEMEGTVLKEGDVGITEYISSTPGFRAIIKLRYSDFIVNEIDEEGKLVKLTNLDVDPTLIQAMEEKEGEEGEDDSGLEGVLSPEQKEMLDDFNANPDGNRTIDICSPDDKDTRTKLHKVVKELYKNLESDSFFENETKFIRITAKGKGNRAAGHFNRQRPEWPTGCGNYCRFVLYKENMDTIEAIYKLSKFFHINKNMFQFAGTKDKRAFTSQDVTVYRVKAERLASANRHLYQIRLGNFRYVDRPLKLGQLSGNRFTIVLREVTGSEEVINTALESLKTHGFINYFGMQRFGTTSIPTYTVGKELLRGNFKEAGELILQPRAGEKEYLTQCRKSWWKDKNCMQMLSALPRKYNIERALLEGLIKYGENNYANAFQMIHRNTRMLYIHGYQSYIWNCVVSRRLKEFGLKPVVGDLVYKGDLKDLATKDENQPSGANGNTEDSSNSSRLTPAVVTEETLSQYTIQDVLLPLPGFDVLYPENKVGMWYTELLAADGLTVEGLKNPNKQYALTGRYRRLIVLPNDLKWQLYMYSDYTKQLTQSDLDLIQEKPEPTSDPDGNTKALKIELSLPQSCYATMALREILKIDTSSAYQITLNPSIKPDQSATAEVVTETQNQQQTSDT